MCIRDRTKALILCSPSNPTGSVYSQEELKGLADVLAKHPQVIVIADEIYEHINYIGKHQSIAQFPEMKDRTVIVNGVSKAYAMTGWRIGFIAGPESVSYTHLIVSWALIFWGSMEAVRGICQLYGFSDSGHSLYAMTGSFFNPGPYSGYLAMVLPVCLHQYLIGDGKMDRVFAGGAGLLIPVSYTHLVTFLSID